MACLDKSFPWCFRALCERGDKTIARAGGIRWHQENIAFRHNGTDGHTNFQKPRQHSQSLHRSKPDGFPELRGEVDTSIHLWHRTFLQFSIAHKKTKAKNSFFLEKSHRVYKPQLRAGHMSSSCWPAQNKHNSSFGEFLFSSHNALVGYFSFLLIFSYIYCIFWFGVFNDFVYVWMYMSLRVHVSYVFHVSFNSVCFVLFWFIFCFPFFFLKKDTKKNKSRMFEEEMMKGIYIFYEKLIFNKKVFSSIYHFSHLNNSTFVLHDLVPVLYWTIFPQILKESMNALNIWNLVWRYLK